MSAREGRKLAYALIALALFAGVSPVLAGLVLFSAPWPQRVEPVVEFLFMLGIVAFSFLGMTPYARLIAERGLGSPVVFLNPAIFYPATIAVYFGISAMELTDWEIQTDPIVYFAIYLALGSFLLGTLASKLVAPVRANSPSRHYAVKKKDLSLILLCYFALGILAFGAIARQGLPIFSASVQGVRAELATSVSAYTHYLSFLLSDVAILIGWSYFVSKRAIFSPVLDGVVYLMCILLLFTLGSRTRVLYPVLVPYIFHLFIAGRAIRFRTIGATVAALALLLVYGAYRVSLDFGLDSLQAFKRVFFGELNLAGLTLQRIFDFFPERQDFLGLDAMFWGVLAVLPGETTVLTTYLAEALKVDLIGTGFTPTIIGGFYVLGGFPTLALGMGLFGFLFQSLFRLALSRKDPVTVLMFAYSVVYALNILKGGFLKDAEPIWHLGVLWFAAKVTTVSYRRSEETVWA